MLGFVGLKGKLYVETVSNQTIKKSKVDLAANIRKVCFNDYKNSLFNHDVIKQQHLIRSTNNNVLLINKIKLY